ncbi:glycosyltransferase family 32 protein [Clostridium grantii]|uniref:Capsular polysaccharide synthesis protein n=1 Tax=Clostridium grantii DSM 8605 TaxID=1121316 RepID=A0A1M5UZB4_9CLOT|nr:capsular polysaccharide synthesis protein [Clostridium grantii]SHH68266.1 Capsular polysaccharide synthesis protein [Clostridium grantii DSM 8605]
MDNKNIPKIIHYCWFSGKEKPNIVKKCIYSWKEKLPNYEIKEWNEDNFDININMFVRQAYNSGKFAFVSDYVRVYVLYKYGGIYLDTDVEVLQSLNKFLEHESFWGFEEKNYIATSTIGARKGNPLIKEFLDTYENKRFVKENGSIDTLTNVSVVSEMIQEYGIKLNGEYQEIEGLCTIYPQTYFSPYDYINCYSKANANSFTTHHFFKSWLPFSDRVKTYLKVYLAKVIGGKNIALLRNRLFTR